MAITGSFFFFFFFNDTATTEIYTLSLHDALPIYDVSLTIERGQIYGLAGESGSGKSTLAYAIARLLQPDRKSTRLNSSHQIISYAVFCLKKKKPTDPSVTRDKAALPSDSRLTGSP